MRAYGGNDDNDSDNGDGDNGDYDEDKRGGLMVAMMMAVVITLPFSELLLSCRWHPYIVSHDSYNNYLYYFHYFTCEGMRLKVFVQSHPAGKGQS